jgi:predicted ATP-dependent endonuclease of OLD family
MKLIRAKITNFRCIDNSNEFKFDPVTCLVGKNESGKTALLLGLERLNPSDPSRANFDKLLDYPRKRLADYEELHPGGDANVLETHWTLDAKEIDAVEKQFGSGVLKDAAVSIRKGYDNQLRWVINVDDAHAVKQLVAHASLTDDERNQIGDVGDLVTLKQHLETLAALNSAGIVALLQQVTALMQTGVEKAVSEVLLPFLPKFLYFSSYDRMNGSVQLEKFAGEAQQGTLSKEDKVFQAFLEFAGVNLEELRSAQKYEALKARVEAASIKISRQIFEYWSQNKSLKVEISVDAARPNDDYPLNSGTIMRTRILNKVHEMTVDFNERSAGFVWFFSFLAMFSQVRKRFGNVIILLDEPGLNLHAKAQHDLLRYIREKLSAHQVAYTTHSPFMVPVGALSSVRTVEDIVRFDPDGDIASEGTKVGDEVLSTDRDTVFPLQGALGYEITQSLFIGEHSLLVEGPSDLLYLKAFSNALKRVGRVGLDERWTICPTGGIDKVPAFVSLFGGNRLHVAVLTDVAKGTKNKIENLRRSKILSEGHILTVADFCAQAEGDVEDLIGCDLYTAVVNRAYELPNDLALTQEAVKRSAGSVDRILPGVEALFRIMPPSAPEFDHYRPASWLASNEGFLSPDTQGVSSTLDRFEALFKSLNALLPVRTPEDMPRRSSSAVA